jgi:Spy/CpxP family protein refolding chaperone
MLRQTMIVLATAAALTAGLTADAFARGGSGHGGGFGGGHGGGFGGGAHITSAAVSPAPTWVGSVVALV